MRSRWLVVALSVVGSAVLMFGSAVGAQAAPAAQPPTNVHTVPGMFQADGKVHTYRWTTPCAKATESGCYSEITGSATLLPPLGLARSNGVIPYDAGVHRVQLTNNYVTCTGIFGNCNQYTQARLVAIDTWNGYDTDTESMTRSCGAVGWNCGAIGPVSTSSNDCNFCTRNIYGPQLYNGAQGSQTKYSMILLHPNGAYQLLYSCTGYLC